MSKKQTPVKSKLFKLKEWLTVPDAARHLSIIFGEEVSEADLLRLALDGHLKLSVYFVNHAVARCGKVVSHEEIESVFSNLPNLHSVEKDNPPVRMMKNINLDGESFLNLDDDVKTISGVWDLSMGGSDRLDVERRYQYLTDGPEVTLDILEGAFVERKDGIMCIIQESFDENPFRKGSMAELREIEEYIASNNMEEEKAKDLLSQHKKNRKEYLGKRRKEKRVNDYYTADGLPHDSVLVVRTEALIDLQERLSPEESTKGKTHKTNAKASFLNNKHAFYAKELKIAVEAWTELYEKNPPPYVPQGGHKKYITKWLEEKHPDLGQRARERISTVINPNPRGGASPTSENL